MATALVLQPMDDVVRPEALTGNEIHRPSPHIKQLDGHIECHLKESSSHEVIDWTEWQVSVLPCIPEAGIDVVWCPWFLSLLKLCLKEVLFIFDGMV